MPKPTLQRAYCALLLYALSVPVAGVAHAQATITSTNAEAMAAMLQDLGYRAKVEYSSSERGHISSGAQGISFVVAFYDCAGPKQCSDVQLQTWFGKSYEGTIQDVNVWNRRKRHAKAVHDKEDGTVGLYMDFTLKGGVTEGYLEGYLETWTYYLATFKKYLSEAH